MTEIEKAIEIIEAMIVEGCKRDGNPDMREALEYARSALCEKQEHEQNAPLTLEELRGMDGEPVWVKEITPEPIDGDYWGLVDTDFNCARGYGTGAVVSTATDGISRFAQTPFAEYGGTWLAYRRPPEE